jgi:aspartyl-tRNA synthetase
VVFIDLRDRSGGVQLVFNPERDAELHRRSNEIRSEYVIAIEGTVSPGPPRRLTRRFPPER